MNKLRKFLAASTLVTTVFGLTVVVNPASAAANDGDLIKMNGVSSVYYLKGGKRFVFPNESTYFSWYSDWNGVKVIPQDELYSYPLGGNVTLRAGTKLVKITTNPTVYAVEPNGVLRSIVSEANAIELWGSNWAKNVVDVADAFFTNYTVGQPLTAGTYPAGTVVRMSGSSDLYYFDGSNYRKFANDSAFLANGFNFAYVVTTNKTVSKGGSDITSAEAALMNVAQGSSTGQTGGVYTGGTGMTVALSSNTPAAANVAKGATQVPFLAFNVTASNDGDVTVKNVTVTRAGIGAYSDFNNVYLYDGTTRLTTGRSINSSTNKASFSGVNLVVPKGTTKTLMVKADMGTGTINNNYFAINAATDIETSGAAVSGSFPIMGNTMVGVNQSVGSITIDRSGSLANPKAGEKAVKVAEFKLTAGSSEDVEVKSIVLYNSGSLSADKLTNFVLKQDGTTVATAATQVNSLINFQLTTPIAMDKGNSRVFEVYADIAGNARANDTVNIYLDNNADLYATGKTYGFGTTVIHGSTGYTSATPSTVTVQAGQLTMSFQGPAVQDYATQGNDVELFRFNVSAQANLEIRKTYLALTATGSNLVVGGNAHYTDIKFVDITNGKNSVIVGPKDVTAAALTETLTFTDTWNLNAGETKTIKVTADVANFTPAGNETIKATLNAFVAGADVKNLDTNTFLAASDMVPSGNIAGNVHNIKAATVSLTKAGTPAAQSYINGKQGVDMLGVNVTAGQGKDVKVTSLTVTATGANSCATETDCVLSVKLYDGATQVGDTKSLDGTNKAVFSNLNVTVPKGTTKTLLVKADLNNLSAVAGGTTLKFDVAAAGDISAQDIDGNTVSNASTVTGNTMNIVSTGSLTAAPGATVTGETDSRLVAAGSNEVILGRFRFNATNEDLQLNKIRIKVQKNGAAAADTEIAGIALFDGTTKLTDDYTTPSASGAFAVADFTLDTNADKKFIVSKDGYKELTVKANVNTISAGAAAGARLVVSVDFDDNFQFRGANGSNTTISSVGAADVVASNTLVVYKSAPTVAISALPTTVLTGGEQTLSKFSVSADAKGAINWTQITFTVTGNAFSAGAGDVTAARLVDESGTTVANVTCDVSAIAAATNPTGNIVCTATTDQTVGAGSSRTYQLKGTIAGAIVGSTLSTIIAGDAAWIAGDTHANQILAKNFVWSDESASGHAIGSTTDYFGGYLVKTLPADSQTLAK